MSNLDELLRIINYNFRDVNLLIEALTHPSTNGQKNHAKFINYQRLEFLGDAILSMVISEMLIKIFPDDKEGLLAKKKIALTCGTKLAEIARSIKLGSFIIMTNSERMSGGEDNPNNLENSLEGLIAAIYLDSDLVAVKKFIYHYWLVYAKEMIKAPQDNKTTLQELVQSMGLPVPAYNIIDVAGPSHRPLFTVKVNIVNYGEVQAIGNNKKSAEQKAASLMLQKIKFSL